jgi:hypothetical protein
VTKPIPPPTLDEIAERAAEVRKRWVDHKPNDRGPDSPFRELPVRTCPACGHRNHMPMIRGKVSTLCWECLVKRGLAPRL